MTAHGNSHIHWLPQDPVRESPITACGLDVDGPCERHLETGERCRYGLAWTCSTNLAAYQGRPYEHWPPPCKTCETMSKVVV